MLAHSPVSGFFHVGIIVPSVEAICISSQSWYSREIVTQRHSQVAYQVVQSKLL